MRPLPRFLSTPNIPNMNTMSPAERAVSENQVKSHMVVLFVTVMRRAPIKFDVRSAKTQ